MNHYTMEDRVLLSKLGSFGQSVVNFDLEAYKESYRQSLVRDAERNVKYGFSDSAFKIHTLLNNPDYFESFVAYNLMKLINNNVVSIERNAPEIIELLDFSGNYAVFKDAEKVFLKPNQAENMRRIMYEGVGLQYTSQEQLEQLSEDLVTNKDYKRFSSLLNRNGFTGYRDENGHFIRYCFSSIDPVSFLSGIERNGFQLVSEHINYPAKMIPGVEECL